jgi:glycosyl transferase family 25
MVDLLGGVFYINLDHRTDRRAEIEKELTEMELPFERFPAIRTAYGLVGCGLSHLALLKMAKARGYPNVLIFEDDFQFLVSKEHFHASLQKILTAEYDVIMLGYNTEEKPEIVDGRMRLTNVQSASGYIVHSRMYDALIAVQEESVKRLAETEHHWIYANDQSWKILQPSTLWYALYPRTGKQRPSMSDTDYLPRFTDYGC